MKRVLIIAGTRPEVIKLAPVVKAFRALSSDIEAIYCSTGQHREMLDQANRVFALEPDIDLGLMAPGQTLAGLTALLFAAIDGAIQETKPDVIIVQGDTTSAYVGAMCGFYRRLAVGHVEAGLRTGNIYSPFPEELNRCMVGRIATHHFAPTTGARDNLLREGTNPSSVFVTGNTVVDALNWVRSNAKLDPSAEISPELIGAIGKHRLVLVTSHRRESLGDGLANTCNALLRLAEAFPDIVIVYPVHLNPAVREPVHHLLRGHERIHLLPPVTYPTLLWLMSASYLILSDSGGIQEEAPSFQKPLLVLRETTERPEVVEAGCAKLVGTDPEVIFENASILLTDRAAYAAMSGKQNPFGDGSAADRIVELLAKE